MSVSLPQARSGATPTLRQALRTATSPDHERLDRTLGALDLARRQDYARFLRVQLASRAAIDPVLAARLGTDAPPSQQDQLAADLAALGSAPIAGAFRFILPERADPLGACWALAGSHLGNRMMLRRLSAEAPSDWPTAFLADDAMPAYWASLAPRLAQPPRPQDPAIGGARAVFALFLTVAAAEGFPTSAPAAA